MPRRRRGRAFWQEKGHPVDYLVAASADVEQTQGLPYSDWFRELLTSSLNVFDVMEGKAEQPGLKEKPDLAESAAITAIAEAVRLAISRRDVEAVAGILAFGIPVAMRLKDFIGPPPG